MSTMAEERRPGPVIDERPEQQPLDRLLAWRPALTWETAALAAIFLLAFALRFWDLGARAMHHDESLHATYSYYLYDGRGYEHHPLMHGPFLFHAMALVYLLFGASDATARFVPAAFGTAMVLLPLLLRPWLGRAGTLAAAALLALSPSLLYFSRFVGAGAQDIIVIVGMLMMVAGIWHYLRTEQPRWIYLIAAGLALGFTTKEVTYMLAALLVVYLDGAAAADLAAQMAHARGWSDARRRLTAAALVPVAWVVTLFWPWLGRPRARLGMNDLPRAAGPMIVIGTLAAPMFSAGAQVLLERVGITMAAQSAFSDWTNEKLWGAITITGLIVLGAYIGTLWKPKEWGIAALIFWGISVPLFTTFFTNPDGIATGIWGSLDYWLQQQDVRRGTQPVFYYLMLTPVYEYLTMVLGLAGVVYAAVKTGRDTIIAAVIALLAALGAAVLGDGAYASLPFALVALVAATYATRGFPFTQFLVFWTGALLLGLSVAGEKMPWLETHLALPLALLSAFTIERAARALPIRVETMRRLPHWAAPVAAFAGLGVAAAVLALASDRLGPAIPLMLLALLAGVVGTVALAVRRVPGSGLAAVALVLGFLGPLSVRTAVVAAFENGDTPVEMAVYTQTTPELKRIKEEIDRYARESGQGQDVQITVDASEAFTWPWAWYLRDYKRVQYPDLSTYQNNPSLISSLTSQGGILLTQLANANIGASAPDVWGPGQRYKHRWWFPEEYRTTTTAKLFAWLRDGRYRRLWTNYFLHRTVPSPLGSIDAVAYFPTTWTPSVSPAVEAQPAPEPRTEQNGAILVAGAPGSGSGQLQRPAGVAVDRDGNVYVADSLNNRVQKFDAQGRFQNVIGPPGAFREPWGVTVAADGTIYVADTWNHRIQKLDPSGKVLKTWGRPPQANVANPDPLELYGPRAIAIDSAGNLLVTDTGHSRIVRFSPDGQPLGTFGTLGTGQGQFQEPVAIAVAPNGDILVTDTWNGRVQRFDANFGFKGEYRVSGWEDRGVENKPYLAVAPDGAVYVTVPDGGQVLVFGADGRAPGTFSTLDTGSAGATRPRPVGIAVDPNGPFWWVADGAGGQLVRLGPK